MTGETDPDSPTELGESPVRGRIRLQTLGGLAAFAGHQPLGGNAQQPRRLAVLAILARAGDRGVSRDRLAGLLWGEIEEERARRNLNQALYALRQDLGAEEAILGTRDLRLNPDLIDVDLAAFEVARRSGALEEAARLYGGHFLGDFHLPGIPAFARWAEGEREALATDYRAILIAVAAAATRRSDLAAAVHWWRRLAALDPTDTRAAVGVMRALAAAGDVAGALRHAEIFGQIHARELDLPADPMVADLAARIRRGEGVPPATALLEGPELEQPAPAVVPPLPSPPAAAGSTERVPSERSPLSLRALLLGIAALLVGGVLLSSSRRPPVAVSPLRRIAVLPFENQGDSADGYFADGMTDELRGKLTAIPGLEVVASLSSNDYRGTAVRLPEVASALGVEYLLVGKIRWQRDSAGASRVRVSPELIRIAPGAAPTTRWQYSFDTTLTDVFRVQADIAGRVASALDLVLADSARRDLMARPTENLAAYDEFLKGEAAAEYMKADQAGLRRAIEFYQRAVTLDTGFAQAWSQLSRARTSLYSNGVPDPELGVRARQAAERARRLKPADPLVYLALGDYYGSVNPVDNRRAMIEYERGLALAPDQVDLLTAAATTETSLGRWDGVASRLARAAALDPRSVSAARRQTAVNLFLRNYAAADSAADRAIALAPGNPTVASLKVMVAVARGDLPAARRLIRTMLASIDPEVLYPFLAYYQDLYWILDDQQQVRVMALPVSSFDNDRAGWAMVRAGLSQLRGDRPGLRIYADSARLALLEQTGAAPEDGQRRVLLGVALAYLGRKDEAVQEGRRGLELMPISRDGYFGPYVQLQLARIYILVGEPELALDQLEPLLKVPFYLSPGWLRIDPTFDPLRSHPRFRRLVGR